MSEEIGVQDDWSIHDPTAVMLALRRAAEDSTASRRTIARRFLDANVTVDDLRQAFERRLRKYLVLAMYMTNPTATWKEVGRALDVTAERARQLCLTTEDVHQIRVNARAEREAFRNWMPDDELSTRTCRLLKRENLTLEAAWAMSDDELLAIRELGPKMLFEIRELARERARRDDADAGPSRAISSAVEDRP